MRGSSNVRHRSFFERIGLLVGFLVSFLLILGAYYFFYVQRKSSYLVSRNFRFLASLGAQLDSTVQSQGRVLRNLAKKGEFVTLLEKDPTSEKIPREMRQKRRKVLDSLAPMLDDVKVHTRKDGDGGSSKALSYQLEATTGGHRIEISAPLGEKSDLVGHISLSQMLQPLFRSTRAFEALLLANHDGQVFFQKGAPDLSITNLTSLVRFGESEASKTSLFQSSRSFDVELSGHAYRLFVEPVSLPILPGRGIESSKGSQVRNVWLVCGLTAKRDLFYKSFAVSSALLILIMGILVLTILSWPFVKLNLLGERQRVNVFDVLLLGVCTLLGTSILMLFLCDAAAYTHLKRASKKQIEQLAGQIAENLTIEIRSGYKQLEKLEEEAAPELDEELERGDAYTFWSFEHYPFPETFMVIDEEGMQQRKWLTEGIAPPKITVASREYFQRAAEGNTWVLPPAGERPRAGPLAVQSTVGWTDGQKSATLSKPAGGKLKEKYAVSALSLPMMSVINPVLPPGFEFAVIDNEEGEGMVLFHSDPRRNLGESFFVEVDQDRRLRAAVFARRSETLNIRYWGEDYVARVVPIQGLPWTVVALRDSQLLRAVNVEWVVTSGLFISLFIGTIALASILVVILRPTYRASWLWPDTARASDYSWLAVSYLLLTLSFLWILYRGPEGEGLLLVSLLAPLIAGALAYGKLGPDGLGKKLGQAAGVIFLSLLFYAVCSLPAEGPSVAELFACLGVLGSCALVFLPDRLLPRGPLFEKWSLILTSRLAEPESSLRPAAAGLFISSGRALSVVLCLAVFLAILTYAVRFVTRKVFLLDVLEPLWAARSGSLLPGTVGSNVFLISRKENWNLDRQKFFPIDIKTLDGDKVVWASRQLELIRSLPDRNILVESFEHKISDRAFNEIKLSFLEDLIEQHQRTVVVLSTVSPFSQDHPREARRNGSPLRGDLKERWRSLLASFTLIDLDLRPGTVHLATEGLASLREECGEDPFLRQIAMDLAQEAEGRGLDREQVLEEFSERAESRYRAIWASCSKDEEIVLEHLAEEGLVNEKNRKTLRRLMAQGLIRRTPHLQLFNETFRRFVISSACRPEVLKLERRGEPSAWDRFRWPFFIGVSAMVAFFFSTQEALFEGTIATITGVTAGLPAVVKVLDLFGGNRLGAARMDGGR